MPCRAVPWNNDNHYFTHNFIFRNVWVKLTRVLTSFDMVLYTYTTNVRIYERTP